MRCGQGLIDQGVTRIALFVAGLSEDADFRAFEQPFVPDGAAPARDPCRFTRQHTSSSRQNCMQQQRQRRRRIHLRLGLEEL